MYSKAFPRNTSSFFIFFDEGTAAAIYDMQRLQFGRCWKLQKVLIDFDEHPLFMFARLLAEAVPRAFGDAFDVAGAVLRAFEDALRTTEGCF